MRRALSLCVAAAAVMTLAGGRIEAAPAGEAVRAGDLAVQLARAAGVRLPAEAPEKRAAEFLRARGITLAPTADTPLMAGDLVVVARSLGVPVSAAAPATAVTPAQATAFVGAVRGTLRAVANGHGNGNGGDKEGDINASCRGREARSGRNGTPASPADPNATAPPCDGEEPTP
ncbi:MAG TPA: hypothetical protein VMQ62_07740 [Dongiaceae bacterium]|nr:hypothetical protein [Dongiaceae bacterium]